MGHRLFGALIDDDNPLPITFSGGSGSGHVIGGAVIDERNPMAIKVIGAGVVRVVDAGLISVASIFDNGPAVLYTPTGSERVVGAGWSDEGYEAFQPLSTASAIVKPQGISAIFSNYLEFFVHASTPIRSHAPLLVSAHPVIMQIADGDLFVPAAVGTWQANHAYSLGDAVLAPTGSLQVVITAGTSGGSEPSWVDLNSGQQTTDNTVHWTEAGPRITQGKLHIYVMVATLPA